MDFPLALGGTWYTGADMGVYRMKCINQLEYPDLLYITRTTPEGEAREKGKTSTIKSSGCGL